MKIIEYASAICSGIIIIVGLILLIQTSCENDNIRNEYYQLQRRTDTIEKECSELKETNERLVEENEALKLIIDTYENDKKDETAQTEANLSIKVPTTNANASSRTISQDEDTEEDTEAVFSMKTSSDVTNLSIAELNGLVRAICEHRGIEYDESPMKNTGKALKTVEDEYNISALYILTIFTIESGLCEQMPKSYNAAGLRKGGKYIEFDSTYDCILYLGKLLRTYSDKYDLNTIKEISGRYCEQSDHWVELANNVGETYVNIAYKNTTLKTLD